MIFNIICLLAFLRLLCFLVIHYKNNVDMTKSEQIVILNNIMQIRKTLDIYCIQESVFGVYCKLNMDKMDEKYPMLYQESIHVAQNDDTMNIENIKNIERSYYGIYKDNILFA